MDDEKAGGYPCAKRADTRADTHDEVLGKDFAVEAEDDVAVRGRGQLERRIRELAEGLEGDRVAVVLGEFAPPPAAAAAATALAAPLLLALRLRLRLRRRPGGGGVGGGGGGGRGGTGGVGWGRGRRAAGLWDARGLSLARERAAARGCCESV